MNLSFLVTIWYKSAYKLLNFVSITPKIFISFRFDGVNM